MKNLFAEGGHVVVDGESNGDGPGMRKYWNDVALIFRLEEGKIVELREYVDSSVVISQKAAPWFMSE